MSCSKTVFFFFTFPGKNSASVNPTANITTNTISSISDVGELGLGVGSVEGLFKGGVGGVGVEFAGVCGNGVGCSCIFGSDTVLAST